VGRAGAYGSGIASAVFVFAVGREAAAAAPAQATLAYTPDPAAAACLGAGELRDAVAERLGYDAFSTDASASRKASGEVSTVAVRLTHAARGWHAEVRRYDARGALMGERAIDSAAADCKDITDATALAIALALDPAALLETPPPPPSPAPAAAPGAALVALEPPRVARDAAPAAAALAVRAHAGVGPIGSAGTAPRAAAGIEAWGGVAWGRFRVDLEGRADLPAAAMRVPDTGASGAVGVRAELLAVTIAPSVAVGRCQLGPVFSTGVLRADGVTRVDPRHIDAVYGAIGGRAAIVVGLGSAFALRTHLDLLAPLARTTLSLGSTDVWSAPPIAVALGSGVEARFP
jgi:hypothetical protein